MYHETIKVRDLAPESTAWKKVRSSLNQAAVMIGSVSVLSDNEYLLMKDFLTTEYKDFSAEEMIIAFKKVSSGSIIVDMQHFGKLSPMYLGAVLKAFKVERHKALAEELKHKPKEVIIASQEDKANIREEFLERCLFKPYKGISESGTFEVDLHIAAQLFRIFKRVNLIDITAQDGEYYEPLAIKSLQEEYKSDVRTNRPIADFWERINKMHKGQDKPLDNRITDRCQGLYFIDYVMKLHKSNRDIKMIAKEL